MTAPVSSSIHLALRASPNSSVIKIISKDSIMCWAQYVNTFNYIL